MQIFVVIPFIKQQNNTYQLNGEKWDVELGHLPAFGWTMLFSHPLHIIDIGMPTFFQALEPKTTRLHWKQICVLALHLFFSFLLFNYLLFKCHSVELLIKGITPQICMLCFVL